MSQIDIQLKEKIDLDEPNYWKVIYMNDDRTTVEFVIQSLIEIFDYEPTDAAEITMKIHDDGSAVVGVYPYEISEQKAMEVVDAARKAGYPLEVKIEEDKQ